MKEKAKNVKTDRKFWTDPMSFPVFGAEAHQVGRGKSKGPGESRLQYNLSHFLC